MTVDFQSAEKFFAIAANASRLKIICSLSDGEMSVSQLTSAVGIAQSPLSQHLRRLRDADIVEFRKEGVNVFYRLVPGEAERLILFLYRNFGPQLTSGGTTDERGQAKSVDGP